MSILITPEKKIGIKNLLDKIDLYYGQYVKIPN